VGVPEVNEWHPANDFDATLGFEKCGGVIVSINCVTSYDDH
jgi:hypothetical protein